MTSTDNLIISAKELGRRYGKQWALRDLTVELRRGEVLGFIGPNGAGKSTFIKLLAGLTKPSSGELTVLGLDPFRRIPDGVALVAEHMGLVPHLSARRNLELLASIRGTASRGDIDSSLDRVGLDPDNRKAVRGFSLGMKQRLLLAQALMEKPRLLLLDEPTNGLDPEAIIAVRALIQELARNEGVTVVLASHLLTEVERICDRVLLVSRGSVRRTLDLRDMVGTLVRLEDGSAIDQVIQQLQASGQTCEAMRQTSEILIRDRRPVSQVIEDLVDANVKISEARPARASLEAEFLRILDGGAAL